MAFRKETIRKEVGFSKEEWEIVCKKAKSARLRTGTYIRRMSVKGEIKYYELKELVTLKRAFLSIGNNLNQLTRAVNAGFVRAVDLGETKQEVQKVWQSLNSLLRDAR
mgnify:CR=1 FL=1